MTFAESTKSLEELNQKFNLLVDTLNGVEVQLDNGTNWKIVGPQTLLSPSEYIEDSEGFNEQIETIKDTLFKAFVSEGLTDENTIGDFAQTVLQDKVLPGMGVNNPEAAEALCNFLLNGGDGKSLRKELSPHVSKETLDLIGVKREHNADVKEDIHFEYPYYPGLDAGDYCTYVFYQL